jgi:RNA polymerase sigma factor (sigma-70 family)
MRRNPELTTRWKNLGTVCGRAVSGFVEASLGTDEGLIERATSGDADAFAELVAPHLALARRIAASAGQASDAEDAVQNALMKAHRSLASLDAGREFAPWFLTIVRNEALNQGRTTRRHEAAVGRLIDQPQQFASAPAEDIAIADVRRADVRAAVDRLNPTDRAVIETRFLQEHTEAETAAELGLPIGTVKSRTSRALRRLRVAMVALVIMAAVLAIAPVRRAVAGWLGLRGVRIEQPIPPPESGLTATSDGASGAPSSGLTSTVLSSSATSQEVTTTAAPTAGFGETTTLEAARKAVTFALRVPSDSRLGDPDLVTLERDVAEGLVTLWWKPNDRLPLPASPTNRTWGMSFSAFRGSVEDWSFSKMLGPNAKVEFVKVQGASGRWIEGEPHQLAIAPNGATLTNRLATNTLVWEKDGITYRLEAKISRDLALSIAETVK